MGVIAPPSSASALNPNAPLFVPLAYRMVEDFSDDWWDLVQSSSWFRDYWLRECFHDPETDPTSQDIYDAALLPDDDEVFDSLFFDDCSSMDRVNDVKGDEVTKEIVRLGAMKWHKGRTQVPRHVEKAPKIVSVRVSPRTIQQPR